MPIAEKSMDTFFKLKKLLVSAIFDPEYSEFFLNQLYDHMIHSEGNIISYEFNDGEKVVMFTYDNQITNFDPVMNIRIALAATYIDIMNNGRMHDILYLKDAEAYSLFSSNIFTAHDIALMFNINSFGNGKFALSLIQ